MIILAIDPGTTESGYVVWDGSRVLEKGVYQNDDMLITIGNWVSWDADILAIEEIGHFGTGMPAGKEVFLTCRWTGRFIQRWIDSNPHRPRMATCVLRSPIKTHLCGTPRAKDANVRQAVVDRLGSPGTKKTPGVIYGVTSHSMQALAVALYVSDMLRCGFELPRVA